MWKESHLSLAKVSFLAQYMYIGVLRGSVVKRLTRNPGVLDPLGFFVGVSFGKTLQSPRKDMNNASCRRDITEILLKAA